MKRLVVYRAVIYFIIFCFYGFGFGSWSHVYLWTGKREKTFYGVICCAYEDKAFGFLVITFTGHMKAYVHHTNKSRLILQKTGFHMVNWSYVSLTITHVVTTQYYTDFSSFTNFHKLLVPILHFSRVYIDFLHKKIIV